MKYTTLTATKFDLPEVSISTAPTNPEWYKQSKGFEFLVGIGLTIQGATQDEIDETNNHLNLMNQTERLFEQNELEYVCELSGVLILADEMTREGYEPYEVCDNFFEELEFVYSVLKTYNMDYNEETKRMRNVLSIDHVSWNEDLDLETKIRVIHQIKGFIIELYHTLVDVICFNVAPLEEDEDYNLTDEEKELMVEMLKKLIEEQNGDEAEERKIIDFSQFMELTRHGEREDEQSTKDKESNYAEATETKLHQEFSDLGFKEVGNTGLLAKFF